MFSERLCYWYWTRPKFCLSSDFYSVRIETRIVTNLTKKNQFFEAVLQTCKIGIGEEGFIPPPSRHLTQGVGWINENRGWRFFHWPTWRPIGANMCKFRARHRLSLWGLLSSCCIHLDPGIFSSLVPFSFPFKLSRWKAAKSTRIDLSKGTSFSRAPSCLDTLTE